MTPDRKFILIVDDSKDMREFLSDIVFRPEGYQVEMADCVEAAIEIIKIQTPDFIVSDFNMPGMNGLDMLDWLRENDIPTPMILVTATGSEKIAIRAFRAGVIDYFIKPFEPLDLVDKVNAILLADDPEDEVPVSQQPAQASGLMNLDRIISVGKKITTLRERDDIQKHILEAAVFLSGAHESRLTLIDLENDDYSFPECFIPQTGHRSSERKLSEKIVNTLIETNRPLFVEPAQPEGAEKQITGIHAPVLFGEDMLGILSLKGADFSPEKIGVINGLSEFAAIALHNSELHDQVKRDQRKLSHLVENLKEPILLVDESQRIILVNKAAYTALGIPKDYSPLFRPLRKLTPNKGFISYIEDALTRKTNLEDFNSETGRVYRTQVSDIEDVGQAIVFQDITDIRNIEDLREGFIINLSHDLRSPLTTILSYTSLIQRTENLSEDQRRFAVEVKESVANITRMLDELLEASSLEVAKAYEFDDVDLKGLLHDSIEVIQPSAKLKNISINFDSNLYEAFIRGDEQRLEQAFVNILDNAVKYTDMDGHIHLSLDINQRQVLVGIQDDGIGIPEDEQSLIFNKFYRGKDVREEYQGTGMGLNIVRSIIESHNGRIWTESKPGTGSTFTVILPLTKRRV